MTTANVQAIKLDPATIAAHLTDTATFLTDLAEGLRDLSPTGELSAPFGAHLAVAALSLAQAAGAARDTGLWLTPDEENRVALYEAWRATQTNTTPTPTTAPDALVRSA